jgi:hypothetical protein
MSCIPTNRSDHLPAAGYALVDLALANAGIDPADVDVNA